MKSCIIGGGGYFGQHIAKKLQLDGRHTVLLDVNFANVPYVTLDETLTTRIKGSLLDTNMLDKALEGCDSCYHIAAVGMSGVESFNHALMDMINIEGTRLVIEYCRLKNVKRLIFSSSVCVIFTANEVHRMREDAPYPDEAEYFSYYSATKATAEKMVLAANSEELKTVSCRLRGIYGPGEPRVTDRAAEVIYRGGYCVTFEKSNNPMTQYSGVHNSSNGLILADRGLEQKPEVVGGQVYHIVDEPPISNFGFWHPLMIGLNQPKPFMRLPYFLVYFVAFLMELVCCRLNLSPPLNRLEVNLMAITNTYSIDKAKKDLGYKPVDNHDLSEVVSHYQRKFSKTPLYRVDVHLLLKFFASLFFFFAFTYLLMPQLQSVVD